MQKPFRTLVNAAIIGLLSTTTAQSAGFSLYMEDNGYAVGNFGAGLAAEAADASTGWFNPAGLILIGRKQVVGAGVGIFPASKLSGTSTFNSLTGFPPPMNVITYRENFSGLKSAKDAIVPSGHMVIPIGENAAFGLSLVSPFGLATDWGTHSPVRYQATLSDLMTMNVSPELAGRISDNFSIGAGIDIQYARVKFNQMLGAATVLNLFGINPALDDSLSYNRGHSYGVGFHAGVLGMFNDNHTRIGLNYQSIMRHKFHGYSQLNGNLANNVSIFPDLGTGYYRSDDLFSNYIKFPELVTLSGYQDINEKLALLGSVVFTGWDVFKAIQLNNVAAVAINSDAEVAKAIVNSNSPQNYSNAWRLAIGANYKINPMWMLRVGGGYDQTPTNDVNRDVRLPDSDRWGLSVGSHIQVKPNLGVDVGYTHLFGDTSHINRTDNLGPTSTYNVNATGESYADIVSAQIVWDFDEIKQVPTK